MDISLFTQLGFTQNETKVYLALSELGTVTIGKIQKKTGLVAPRIYESIRKLIEKGIVSSFILNKKQHFSATDHSRIKFFIEEKIDIAKQIISQLPKISAQKQTTSVEVFMGKEGMKTIAEDELTAKSIFVLWGSPHFQEKFIYYRPNFHKRRIKNKINMSAIFAERHKKYAVDFNKLNYTSVKILPYELPITIILYKDRFVITYWSEEIIAVRIINESLVKDALSQFKLFWKLAKKVN